MTGGKGVAGFNDYGILPQLDQKLTYCSQRKSPFSFLLFGFIHVLTQQTENTFF